MNSPRLLLEFEGPEALLSAARALRDAGIADLDAHTPWHVAELDSLLGLRASRVRPVMLVAGLAGGLLILALQWWSSVHGYPLNSGGRPLSSWPAWMFAVFETGVLAAAFAGLLALLAICRLPQLHHPFFAADATEAASDDRFFLSIPAAGIDRAALMQRFGPRRIIEVGP